MFGSVLLFFSYFSNKLYSETENQVKHYKSHWTTKNESFTFALSDGTFLLSQSGWASYSQGLVFINVASNGGITIEDIVPHYNWTIKSQSDKKIMVTNNSMSEGVFICDVL